MNLDVERLMRLLDKGFLQHADPQGNVSGALHTCSGCRGNAIDVIHTQRQIMGVERK